MSRYVVCRHPLGGFTVVDEGTESTPSVHDWRFPTVPLATAWANELASRGSIRMDGDLQRDAARAAGRMLHAQQLNDPDFLSKLYRLADGEMPWEEGEPAYGELGQILFSTTITYPYPADWATDAMGYIAQAVMQHRGDKGCLDSNWAGEPFENDLFVLRGFCLCAGAEHEDGCPPCFEFKPLDLRISWYRWAGRGMTANQPQPRIWGSIVTECLSSVSAARKAA